MNNVGRTKVPQHKFSTHYRECKVESRGLSENDLFQMGGEHTSKTNGPLSAPSSRLKKQLPKTKSVAKNFPSPLENSAAIAAESQSRYPKKNLSPTTRLSLMSLDDGHEEQSYITPNISRSNSRSESRQTVELSIAKKKAVAKPMEEYVHEEEYQPKRTSPITPESFEEIVPVQKVPVPNYHENSERENLDVSAYLIPCDYCGRKFMEDRLVFN